MGDFAFAFADVVAGAADVDGSDTAGASTVDEVGGESHAITNTAMNTAMDAAIRTLLIGHCLIDCCTLCLAITFLVSGSFSFSISRP